jgi:hypothetical protein
MTAGDPAVFMFDYYYYYLKLRTSKKPVDHEKSIDNATKVTKLSSH